MEELIYNNPKQNLEKNEPPLHTIDLLIDGVLVGRAEISYLSKPFPIYQVNELYIEPEYQGHGMASKIMTQVETLLKTRKKTGVLVDGILMGSPASGMYERRGWQEVPDEPGLFAYNLPSHASIEDLRGYSWRYTDITQRKSWKNKQPKK